MAQNSAASEPETPSLWARIKSLHPRNRWHGTNGYRDVLRICLPLIASNISVSAMLFTDRLFLSRYSLEAIAASLPSGVAMVTIASFFQGLIAYVSVFTAQYTGAGRPMRAAASLWQGIYLSFIFGAMLASTYFLAPLIFEIGGHPEHVQKLEVVYYRILVLPAFLNLLYFALSSYLAGLGHTRAVMWGNLFGAFINIPLTYALVFGLNYGGIQIAPQWGIVGAGVATVFSWLMMVVFFTVLIFNRKKNSHVFAERALDFELIRRLISFGIPGGMQRFLELAGFTFFAFVIGSLGEFYLAANNIVFSIEVLSFFPLIGVGAAISILVGQSIGRENVEEAARAVTSGLVISGIYISFIMVLFLGFPAPLLKLFLAEHYDPQEAAQLVELGTMLLRFVVIYTLFDGFYLCYFGALSGAGDVWVPMGIMAVGVFGFLLLPVWLLFTFDFVTVHSLWTFYVIYILSLTSMVTMRFRTGKWRSKKVIEFTEQAV